MYCFAVLMAVNTACYALCNVLMIKIIEFQPVSPESAGRDSDSRFLSVLHISAKRTGHFILY